MATLEQGMEGFRHVVLFTPELFQSAAMLVNGDARKVWIVVAASAMMLLDEGRQAEREKSSYVDALFTNMHFSLGMALGDAKIDAKAFYAKLPGFIERVRTRSVEAIKEVQH